MEVVCQEPGCGGSNLHPVRLVVNAGGLITEVTRAGTTVTRGEPHGRGVSITIDFRGECGHGSSAEYQFHKGTTCLTQTALEPDSEELTLATIWRD
jgi:hypothetical protein